MSANTIISSIVTGGTASHTTTAEEANALATDFVTQGVVGAITLNSGSGGTGSFCVNADGTPDMGVTVKSGQAYITATPSGQNSQILRARASTDYTAYTINANSSGSTKYDWIYLQVDATKANNPASDASDVTSIYTSRSSSNTTDNGSPPTYGLLLAIVTVANGASSITNSNITDKRFNTSIGAQNGSLIVTQQATGDAAIVQAAGTDANIDLQLTPKGTGKLKLNGYTPGMVLQMVYTIPSASAQGTTAIPNDSTVPQNTEGDQYMSLSITPKATTSLLVIEAVCLVSLSVASKVITGALFQDSTANALAANQVFQSPTATAGNILTIKHVMAAGTTSATTFKLRIGQETSAGGTVNFNSTSGVTGTGILGAISKSSLTITEYQA